MERRKQPLSMEHFEKFVGGFVAMGGTEIDFNATIGEPTLDPHLIARARLLHKIPHIQNIAYGTATSSQASGNAGAKTTRFPTSARVAATTCDRD
ncbi:MAG: hypothetical protein BMS9Abin37_1659 [Acidobacteriota bacterium]|nr:MAG: hypothetical protein BMS9Abin37_1659 [Acidobacteriota bacterium]